MVEECRVQQGESLYHIAYRHKLTFGELIAANPQFTANGRDPNLIYPGEAINVAVESKFSNILDISMAKVLCGDPDDCDDEPGAMASINSLVDNSKTVNLDEKLQTVFNDAQLQNIKAYYQAQDYPGAYQYIYLQIKDLDKVDDKTKYWFEQAVGINKDGDTPGNTFIRSYTRKALGEHGVVVDDKRLQQISDTIADKVISDILNQSGVPPLNKILKNDIAAALSEAGQTLADWGGAVYYWDLPFGASGETVGELIIQDIEKMRKLRRNFFHASMAVMEQHGIYALDDLFEMLANKNSWQAGGQVGWRLLKQGLDETTDEIDDQISDWLPQSVLEFIENKLD